MSVTLVKNGTTVALQNPVLQNVEGFSVGQARGLAADGNRRRYGKGDVARRMMLEFANLRESEKTELKAFFDSTVDGAESTFTYTDHEGNAWTARFLATELAFREVDDAQVSVTTFSIGGSDYPTTIREAGVWAVVFELEVVAL